jgi:hypothetical protein
MSFLEDFLGKLISKIWYAHYCLGKNGSMKGNLEMAITLTYFKNMTHGKNEAGCLYKFNAYTFFCKKRFLIFPIN